MSKFTLTTGFLLMTFFLGACAASTPITAISSTPTKAKAVENVTLGVGFIPNVQFAPFYVALDKGFFKDEGLDVRIEYGFENDFIKLVAQGEREFAIGSGDQVILGRSQGLPVKYVMTWYRSFPVGVMALQEKGLNTPAKLEGKKVGIPGLFGASFVGWKALVYSAKLDENRISLESIGFTQAEALQSGIVDAAVIYIANEPILLQKAGYKVDLIKVNDYINLVSNGLIVSDKLIAERPDLVQRMVNATLKGITYSARHPEETFAICRSVIKEITDADAPTQRQVLDTSIALWETEKPGYADRQRWETSTKFMDAMGMIKNDVAIDELFTNQFVEKYE